MFSAFELKLLTMILGNIWQIG